MTAPDRISRAELALALRLAAQREALAASEDHIPLSEAERIALEVGVAPAELRAALRTFGNRRLSRQGVFGPDGVQTAQDTVRGAILGATAHHMLAQGQLEVPIAGGTIDRPGEGLWRLSDARGRAVLQVATRGDETRIAGALDRRSAKWGLLAAGTLVGAGAGSMVAGSVAVGMFGYSVGVLALAPVAALLGGAVLGGGVGRLAWVRVARRSRERLVAALERMRAVAETEFGGMRAPETGPERPEVRSGRS